MLCVAVPAPPLELQENIIPGTETNIATTKETESSINVAEEKDSHKPISDIALESEPAVPFIQTTTPTSLKPATLPVPSPAPAPPTISNTFKSQSEESLPSSFTSPATPATPAPPPQQLSARERQALIGHLGGTADLTSVVLTDKQRLAVFQEKSLRSQGFGAFSSASDNKIQNTPEQSQHRFGQQQRQLQQFPSQQQQQFTSQQQQQFSSQQQLSSQQQQFSSQQQQFSPQQPPQNSSPAIDVSHPEQLLNKLSQEDQQVFLQQFSYLNIEQQTYAFNQFIST